MAEGQQYGGFWARLVAFIIDNAIVFMILLGLMIALGTVMVTTGVEGPIQLVLYLVLTFLPFLYWPVLESSNWQATVGKRVMGLSVTDIDGNRLSFVQALLRALAKFISSAILGIGFLMAAFTARKQALHDIIVKTLVPRTGPSQLWKVLLALVLGFVLMVASAAGLFYYVLMPMFTKGFGDAIKVQTKDLPRAKTIPAPKTTAPAPAAPAAPAVAPPVAAKPAAPAPQATAAAPAGTAGSDADFNAIVGKPLTGLDLPDSTRVGPAILELSTVFTNSVWVKVYLPVPSLNDPTLMLDPVVTVERVLDAGGKDYYDAANTFEKSEFFHRASLKPANTPVPHLSGIRDVHFLAGLTKSTLQKVEGKLRFRVPVDPRPIAFDAKEIGKDKPAHGAVVSLQSVAGNTAKIHYRGASENMLVVRGFGADGKLLAPDSRQLLPERRDVDNDFTTTFKGPPAKVEVVVAARIIERVYPFSVARGSSAGQPQAATAPAAAPAPVSKPEAKAEPKPAAVVAAAPAAPVAAPMMPAKAVQVQKPAVVAAPAPKPRAAPPPAAAAAPAPTAVPAAAPAAPIPTAERPGKPGPKFNDLMTAVLYRDTGGVKELLDMDRWVDKRDARGLTPLMVAARLRDSATAQLLVQRGADVNASMAGASALGYARENGDAAMVDLLRKAGAR